MLKAKFNSDVCARVRDGTRARLDALAMEQNVSLAEVVRNAIERGLAVMMEEESGA
jgi:predicted DNA-binding protein